MVIQILSFIQNCWIVNSSFAQRERSLPKAPCGNNRWLRAFERFLGLSTNHVYGGKTPAIEIELVKLRMVYVQLDLPLIPLLGLAWVVIKHDADPKDESLSLILNEPSTVPTRPGLQ